MWAFFSLLLVFSLNFLLRRLLDPIDTKDFKASCTSMNLLALDVADACPTEDFMITCK
ncbi:hypothetical protein NC651_036379 [Populus alba x Populus x berolinensis]|nr:hypothetical protein NC651_036379 [Populus alba x Populus x berolinensis]